MTAQGGRGGERPPRSLLQAPLPSARPPDSAVHSSWSHLSSEQSTEQPPCRAGWRRCHHTGGQADGGEARGSGSSPPPGAGRRPPPSSNRWVMPQERVTAFPGVLASGKRPQRARLHRDGRQVVEDSSGRALRGGRWQPGRPERRLTFCPGPRLRASRCPKGRDLEEPAQLRAGQGPAAAWTPCGLWRPTPGPRTQRTLCPAHTAGTSPGGGQGTQAGLSSHPSLS